jgi:hypothetical protein
MSRRSSHPGEGQLALYAGGELGVWERVSVASHVRRCAACAAEVETLREVRLELRDGAAAMPLGVNWDHLAAEMKANIRLGLTAGAIVDSASERPQAAEPAGWRWAVVLASLSFVMITGYYLQGPKIQRFGEDGQAAVLLDAGAGGLALQEKGAELTLLNPSQQPVTTTVSWDGGARASFVDSQTGQVTIHHVSTE